MKLWGGRFEGEIDPDFFTFSESFSVDHRLVLYDIRVNRAYVAELRSAGILEGSEESSLLEALEKLAQQVETDPNWAKKESAEDIHTWVEYRLLQETPAAGKLRTGRSRNDLVATLARMWVKDAADNMQRLVVDLMAALLSQAEKNEKAILPGYTHLQRAQAILWPHFLLAYCEMLRRDWRRLRDCAERADELPMGSGALAGASIPINRERLRKELRFARLSQNSLDATSDRDFMVEAMFACALLATHLSRMAEDLILYGSSEFGFVELADAFSTGSSLMPHKKNPDSLELIRGRAGRVQGRLSGLLTTLKGLPSSYDRDLQEDKAALFDAVDTTAGSLRVMARVVGTLQINEARMREAAEAGFLTATEIAEELARRGVPFAEAHDTVGELVRYCVKKQKTFAELTDEEGKKFTPLWDDALQRTATSLESALEKKNLTGGTSPSQVSGQIQKLHKELAELRKSTP